jgi:hypothetical protein
MKRTVAAAGSKPHRCGANMARTRQSGPDPGLCFQVKVVETFQDVLVARKRKPDTWIMCVSVYVCLWVGVCVFEIPRSERAVAAGGVRAGVRGPRLSSFGSGSLKFSQLPNVRKDKHIS